MNRRLMNCLLFILAVLLGSLAEIGILMAYRMIPLFVDSALIEGYDHYPDGTTVRVDRPSTWYLLVAFLIRPAAIAAGIGIYIGLLRLASQLRSDHLTPGVEEQKRSC